jgi:voltage-gated potassium channel
VTKRRIAIFGHEKIAVDIADYLDTGDNEIIVVDSNEEHLSRARKRGYATAMVDYSRDSDLKDIGIGRDIDIVFCLLPDDAENVFLVISARALDPDVRIVSVADSPESIPKFLAAGADKVVDPYELSGRKIWEILKKPIVSQVIDSTLFGDLDLLVGQVTITKGSFLENCHVEGLSLRDRYNLVLLGMVDRDMGDDFIFRTRGLNHRLGAGDILVVIGPRGEIERLRADLVAGMPPAEARCLRGADRPA